MLNRPGPHTPGEWTPRRLRILLGGSVLLSLALLAGLTWSMAALLGVGSDRGLGQGPTARATATKAGGRAAEVTILDAQPGPLSAEPTRTIVLPAARSVGAAGVPSGFPRTPEGALAQLAAIDRAALEPASVPRAQAVVSGWAAAGGPTPESWSVAAGVAALLSAAGQPATGSTDLTVTADPAMGLIREKATDVVVPCVNLVVSVTVATRETTRAAAADCQRMVWQAHRWVIGPGPEPAASPSTWPGGQASIDAGYRWLEVTP